MNIIYNEDKHIEPEFKILYALSIIFIVMSHCYGGGLSVFNEFLPYCTFAIAPFLFASGYFYKSKYELDVWQFIVKKIKRLIIPLYLWNFFYSILLIYIKQYGFYPNDQVTYNTIFISPITSGLHYAILYGSWFIVPLFIVHIINIVIRKIFSIFKIEINEIAYFIFCLLLGVLGVILSGQVHHQIIMLTVIRVLYFLPFFALGTLYQKYKHYDRLDNFKYFSIIIILILIILYYNETVPFVKINIGDLTSSFILMPYITGILGTAFWLRVSKILVPAIGKSKYVYLLADNTYSIMINQFLGFKLLGAVFAILHFYTPLCSNFNIEAYKTCWDYYYLPHNINQMLILYTFAAISFSILLQKFVMYLKNIFYEYISVKISPEKSIGGKYELKISDKRNFILFLVTLTAYIVWSIVMISNRIPFFDEINAWNIAANCNFRELLEVCKHEGHFMLWYLLIKPFAQFNIGFPISMFIVNGLFAILSVFILWFRAPFGPWLKMFITFSLPVQMFSIYARCYAIGMFFLFLICALYPERKKHPIGYPILILFLANTSVIGTIAGFFLGLIYLYEIFKDWLDKKNDIKILLKPISIFILCAILVFVQIVNCHVPAYSTNLIMHHMFLNFFSFTPYIPTDIVVILHIFLLLAGMKFFISDKKPYVFWGLSTLLIIVIALWIYVLACWHYMFIYLFFVSAMWIYIDKNDISTNFQKLYYFLFCILSFFTIFFFKFPWTWNGFHLPTMYHIKDNIQQYNGSKIFLFPTDSSVIGIVPTLHDYNLEFYDSLGNSFKSVDAYIYQWSNNQPKIDFKGIRHAILSEKKSQRNFVFVATVEKYKPNDELFLKELEHNNTDLIFRPYIKLNDVTIYIIEFDKSDHKNHK